MSDSHGQSDSLQGRESGAADAMGEFGCPARPPSRQESSLLKVRTRTARARPEGDDNVENQADERMSLVGGRKRPLQSGLEK